MSDDEQYLPAYCNYCKKSFSGGSTYRNQMDAAEHERDCDKNPNKRK